MFRENAMKETIYVWVTLSKRKYFEPRYRIYLGEPTSEGGGRWFITKEQDRIHGSHCRSSFERLTGIKLKPGECKRFLWRSPLLPVPKRKKAAVKKG